MVTHTKKDMPNPTRRFQLLYEYILRTGGCRQYYKLGWINLKFNSIKNPTEKQKIMRKEMNEICKKSNQLDFEIRTPWKRKRGKNKPNY